MVLRIMLLLVVSAVCACATTTSDSGSQGAQIASASREGSSDAAEEERVKRALELAGELGLTEMANAAVDLRDDDYRVGPADEIAVEFFLVDELSDTERVDNRGYVRLPLVGAVKVAGLTAFEIEDMLVELYSASYLKDPQIYVDVVSHSSQRVTVIGSVNKPGVYPLTGRTTLLKALALAGGTNRIAKEEEIVVFRAQADGTVVGYQVNYTAVQAGRIPDPEVIGNDRIVVDSSASRVFINGVSGFIRGFVRFTPYTF